MYVAAKTPKEEREKTPARQNNRRLILQHHHRTNTNESQTVSRHHCQREDHNCLQSDLDVTHG
jgi:hypothetical protein